MIEDISLSSLTREKTESVVAGARDPGELSVITGHSSRLEDLAVMGGPVWAQSEAGLQHGDITLYHCMCSGLILGGIKQLETLYNSILHDVVLDNCTERNIS